MNSHPFDPSRGAWIVWMFITEVPQSPDIPPGFGEAMELANAEPPPPAFRSSEIGILTQIVDRTGQGLIVEPFGNRREIRGSELMSHEQAVRRGVEVYPDHRLSPYVTLEDVVEEHHERVKREQQTHN